MIQRPSRGSPKALSRPLTSSRFANVHFRVPLEFSTAKGWERSVELLNSVATHNLIDRNFFKLHTLQTYLMDYPCDLFLTAGWPSTVGLITHQAPSHPLRP